MKLFVVLVLACSFCRMASAEGIEVPDVGSVWESTSVYKSATEDGGLPRKETETIKVNRLQGGRPVFSGKFSIYEGEMIETSSGAVIYANECKPNVPMETLAPPVLPNQCAWHVCRAPPVGETVIRPMIIYAPLFGCEPQPGAYTFKSVRKEERNGTKVMVGNAEITFKGNRRGAWESHIQDGIGEVFAESPEKTTTYHKVNVPLVPYSFK